MDRTTKVQYRRKASFFERLGKSCTGVFIGFCMFLFSFIILYYNEGLSVETALMLDEGLKETVPFDVTARFAFDGKLVHHVGVLQTDQELVDDVFDLHLKCVKLYRKVEVYQWVEYSEVKEVDEGEKVRQEITYSYSTEWKSYLVKSRDFAEEVGHRNPTEMPFEEKIYFAESTNVDGIRLSSYMQSRINWIQTVDKLPAPKKGLDVMQHLHYYYKGKNPNYPSVGDARIHFQCSGVPQSSTLGPSDTVTVIALLSGDAFVPYQTKRNKHIDILYRGSKSISEVFDSENAFNSSRTWILRAFGTILMFVSLSIMSRVVVTLVDWIPIVRDIVSVSVSMFNLSLATFLSLATIAISWLRFRPWLASALFAASVLPWYMSKKRARSYLAR